MNWIKSLGWPIFIIMPLTLGLAPFTPEPHIVEKITMLFNGDLTKPLDIFDFVLHGTPWVLLSLKISTLFLNTPPANEDKNEADES